MPISARDELEHRQCAPAGGPQKCADVAKNHAFETQLTFKTTKGTNSSDGIATGIRPHDFKASCGNPRKGLPIGDVGGIYDGIDASARR
jgi:hypothetical protein